jgi:DNA-binding response OmpR family regulator
MLLPLVLLFSPDDALTNSVITSLTCAGYKVLHFSNGMGALQLIQTKKPVLVILDVALPGITSFAIIRTLRADIHNGRVSIILMGSRMREEDVLIGLEIGADLCLCEDFHPQVFAARVRSLLRRNELT